MSIKQELNAVRKPQLAVDGSEVVGNRGVANVKLARNLFVAQAFTYAADDLVLPFGKRGDSGNFRWKFGLFASYEGAQHAVGQSAVKAKYSPGDSPYGLGDQFRRTVLQQDALYPVAQGLFVKVKIWIAGKHDDLHGGKDAHKGHGAGRRGRGSVLEGLGPSEGGA